MPSGLENLDLKVYIDYPQERINRKGPYIFATDGTQVNAGSKENCIIDPVTLSVFGTPLPMTNEWKTASGAGVSTSNYYRFQKSDFNFTSAGGANDWIDFDYYGDGDAYIISASSSAARQSAAIQLINGVKRNQALFFSYSKLQRKNSDNASVIKLFWKDTLNNNNNDVQLHFKSDGGCDVFRGYVTLTGTIIASTTGNSITGLNTKFSTEITAGQKIYDVYGRELGTVSSVTNDFLLLLGANSLQDFTGSYHQTTPLKVQSYSRTENNYSQERPITTIANPNDQFNDVYLIPMRGRDLLVLTSYGLNFCHTFSDLNVPNPPYSINNYVNVDPISSSTNGTSVPIILPTGNFSIVISQGKCAFQLAKLNFLSNWSIESQIINTPNPPQALNSSFLGTLSTSFGSSTGTGSSTNFSSSLSAGDKIYFKGNVPGSSFYVGNVNIVNSDTEFYFDNPITYNVTNGEFYGISPLSGIFSYGVGSTVVTGSGTSFLTEISLYDNLYDNNDNFIGTATSIPSNTTLYIGSSCGLSASNYSPVFKNVNIYSGIFNNAQAEYFGQTFPDSTDILTVNAQVLSSFGNTPAFNNINNSFKLKITQSGGSLGSTSSSDYGYAFYSADLLVGLRSELTSDNQIDVTSAIESLSLSRNESGDLSLNMSARKKLISDLGLVKPDILSNRSIKVTLKPRVKQLNGTITTGSGTTLVTGVGTSFLTDFSPGDSVYKTDGTLVGIAVSIPDNTNLYTVKEYPGGIEYNFNYSNEPNYEEINLFEGYLDSPDIEYINGINFDNYSLLNFNAIDKKQHLNLSYFNVAPNFDNLSILNMISRTLSLTGYSLNDVNNSPVIVDPSILTFNVVLNRNNSNGQYNFIINLGETAGGFIEKIRSDYAQNFTFFNRGTWQERLQSQDGWNNYSCFFLKDLDYNDNLSPFVSLYLSEELALNDGGIPILESYKRTIKRLQKTYETPEANRIQITGLDKSNAARIEYLKDDVNSQNPTLPPSSRPDNWLGDVFPFVMINDKLNTLSEVKQAGDQFYAKLSPGRELIEFDTDLLTYFNGVSKFTSSNRTALSGTITSAANSKTITGSGTLFLTELSIGDSLYDDEGNFLGIIKTITNNTSLELINNATLTYFVGTSYNNYTYYLNQYDYLDIGDNFYFNDPESNTEIYKIIDWSVDFVREYINPEYTTIIPRNGRYKAKKVNVTANPPIIASYLSIGTNNYPLENEWIVTSGNLLTFQVATVAQPNLSYQTLTFSLGNEPTGMTIDSSSGLLEWTPTVGQEDQIFENIEVIVSDGTNSSSFFFTVRVYSAI